RVQELEKRERDLTHDREVLAQEKQTLDTQGAQTAQTQAAERETLEQAQAALREQRAQLARMMADLKAMQQALRQQQPADVQKLLKENAELRERLLAHQAVPAASVPDAEALRELAELREEAHQLARRLQDADALIAQLKQAPRREGPADLDNFEAE